MSSDPEFDAYVAQIGSVIKRHGWLVQGVFDNDNPAGNFSYTAGLHGRGLPELAMTSIDMRVAAALLNDIGAAHRDEPLRPGGHLTGVLRNDLSLAVLSVTDPDAGPFSAATTYFGTRDIEVLQIVWPDADGRFPWEPGANNLGQTLWGEFVRDPDADRHLDVVDEDRS